MASPSISVSSTVFIVYRDKGHDDLSRSKLNGRIKKLFLWVGGGGGTCSHDPLMFFDFIFNSPLTEPLVPSIPKTFALLKILEFDNIPCSVKRNVSAPVFTKTTGSGS